MNDERTAANFTNEAEGVTGFVMPAESAPAMSTLIRTIVKAAFSCPEAKYYGAFVLILPGQAGPNASLSQVIGNNNLYGSLAPETPWRDMTKQLQTYRYQATSLSRNAMAAVEKTLLSDPTCRDLHKAADQGKGAVRQLLLPQLAKVLADRNCKLEIALEQADAAEVSGLPSGAAMPIESQLKIRFLIDPLNGIPAHRLFSGAKVAVNLYCDEAVDRAMVEQYQARDKRGKLLPIVATVTSIADRDDGAVEIIVAIDDKVQGGAVISKTLRLRRGEEPGSARAANPAESAPARRAAAIPELSPDLLTFIFSGLGAIFLLFLLFFLLTRWL